MYLDNHLFKIFNAVHISFCVDSFPLLSGVIFLLMQRIFIIKYLENTRKHDKGIMINSPLSLLYLHKHTANFCWFSLQIRPVSWRHPFLSSSLSPPTLAPFSFPSTQSSLSSSGLCTRVPSTRNSLPDSAWLGLYPSGSSLKSTSSESPFLLILSQVFPSFLLFVSSPSQHLPPFVINNILNPLHAITEFSSLPKLRKQNEHLKREKTINK